MGFMRIDVAAQAFPRTMATAERMFAVAGRPRIVYTVHGETSAGALLAGRRIRLRTGNGAERVPINVFWR
jgi:hypothetical protein